MWSPQNVTRIKTPNAPVKKSLKRLFSIYNIYNEYEEKEEEERQHNRRRATQMAILGYQEMMEKYPIPNDIAQTKPGTFFPPKEETERVQNRELVRMMLYNEHN
jgi:DNA-binding protein H-NS